MCNSSLRQWLFWLKFAKYSCWIVLVIIMSLASTWPRLMADELSQAPSNLNYSNQNQLPVSDQTFLFPQNSPIQENVTKVQEVVITAYSSRIEETDNDPFITASGKWVEDGIVASNFLPFGTKIRFPLLFPDKTFVVEDRMNERYDSNHIDIWFNDTQAAKEFGVKYTIVEIL